MDLNTNCDICFICQNDSKVPIRKLGSCGLEKVQNALRERKKCQDYARWNVVDRLEAANVLYFPRTRNSCTTRTVMKLSQVPCIRRDYKKYENKTCCTEDDASTSTHEQLSQGLRSKSKPLNSYLCVFCQQQSRENTRLAASLPFSKKLLQAALKDNTLSCRLACVEMYATTSSVMSSSQKK